MVVPSSVGFNYELLRALKGPVETTEPVSGEVLRYDGTIWKNDTLVAGDIPTHTHAAADVTSGTFADARISESSVTQHLGDWVSWTPTFSQSGVSGTYTGVTSTSVYKEIDDVCHFYIKALGTVGVATPDSLYFTPPVTMAAAIQLEAFAVSCLDPGKNAKYISGHAAQWTSQKIGVRLYDATLWSGGPGRGFICSGTYRI